MLNLKLETVNHVIRLFQEIR